MNRDLFGTDGVRGLAGEYPLDHDGAVRIGKAVGAQFAKPGQQVVLAHDPRESSEFLKEALVEGLNAVGVNVVIIGVLPTPGLAYITRENDEFVAGIMITASHNPYQYNGVKVFDSNGNKLSDDTEAALNTLIESDVPGQPKGQTTINNELIKTYEDFLVASAGDFKLEGLKIAVDSANGAASGIGGRVFSRLGAQVTTLFESPDGQNINAGCGATDTAALSQAVTTGQLDLGVALDGDSDRIMLVDSQGRQLNGDHILYIIAKSDNLLGVVATAMTNLGTEHAMAAQGIKLERVAVGDRYVLEGLARTGYKLGGEQSGHVILYDLLATGDALLAAVQTLKAVAASGKSLAEWRDEVKMLPQAIINIPLSDKSLMNKPEIQAYVAAQVEELGGAGRLLIRPSGTEPLARIMVEASDAQQKAEQIAAELKELLV